MSEYGYAGKILDVDLTTRTIKEKVFDSNDLKDYLGGFGQNAKTLWENVKRDTDPLGPENVLAFGVGTFVGTPVPTAARTEVSAKSPLTGLFGTSNSGHYWGGELKYAGYDGLIIRGKAAEPVYLLITEHGVEIKKAESLWGMDAWETITALRNQTGVEDLEAAVIGPAGENLVRFASIQNGPFDAWGRTGVGAVMGSKFLKAVAVRGNGYVRVAAPREFVKTLQDVRKAVYASQFFGPTRKYGTMLASDPYGQFGFLPGRNFQTGVLPEWAETRGRRSVLKYSDRGIACLACPIACTHWTVLKEGPAAGLKMKDMEVTSTFCFGAGCAVKDMPDIVRLTEKCQRLGIDIASAGGIAAFVLELYERRIIDPSDLGFALEWGNVEGIQHLLEDIAYRRGLGAILAEGVKVASQQIPGARKYAMEIKGLEFATADPRGYWSTWTFGYLTSIRGGDYLRARNPVQNLHFSDNPEPYLTEHFGLGNDVYENLDMPDEVKAKVFAHSTKNVSIPRMTAWSEDLISLFNSLGICIRPPLLHTIGPTVLARLYSQLTGIEISSDEMMLCGERIWNLIKLFNLRMGEKSEDSVYPSRFYQEPLPEGPAKGAVLDKAKVEWVLREYYSTRGWGPTGVPTEETLQKLGLDRLA